MIDRILSALKANKQVADDFLKLYEWMEKNPDKTFGGRAAQAMKDRQKAFLAETGATPEQLAEALAKATGDPVTHPVIQRYTGKGGRKSVSPAERKQRFESAKSEAEARLQLAGANRDEQMVKGAPLPQPTYEKGAEFLKRKPGERDRVPGVDPSTTGGRFVTELDTVQAGEAQQKGVRTSQSALKSAERRYAPLASNEAKRALRDPNSEFAKEIESLVGDAPQRRYQFEIARRRSAGYSIPEANDPQIAELSAKLGITPEEARLGLAERVAANPEGPAIDADAILQAALGERARPPLKLRDLAAASPQTLLSQAQQRGYQGPSDRMALMKFLIADARQAGDLERSVEGTLGRDLRTLTAPEKSAGPSIDVGGAKPGVGRIVGQTGELQAYGDAEQALAGMPRAGGSASASVDEVLQSLQPRDESRFATGMQGRRERMENLVPTEPPNAPASYPPVRQDPDIVGVQEVIEGEGMPRPSFLRKTDAPELPPEGPDPAAFVGGSREAWDPDAPGQQSLFGNLTGRRERFGGMANLENEGDLGFYNPTGRQVMQGEEAPPNLIDRLDLPRGTAPKIGVRAVGDPAVSGGTVAPNMRALEDYIERKAAAFESDPKKNPAPFEYKARNKAGTGYVTRRETELGMPEGWAPEAAVLPGSPSTLREVPYDVPLGTGAGRVETLASAPSLGPAQLPFDTRAGASPGAATMGERLAELEGREWVRLPDPRQVTDPGRIRRVKEKMQMEALSELGPDMLEEMWRKDPDLIEGVLAEAAAGRRVRRANVADEIDADSLLSALFAQ